MHGNELKKVNVPLKPAHLRCYNKRLSRQVTNKSLFIQGLSWWSTNTRSYKHIKSTTTSFTQVFLSKHSRANSFRVFKGQWERLDTIVVGDYREGRVQCTRCFVCPCAVANVVASPDAIIGHVQERRRPIRKLLGIAFSDCCVKLCPFVRSPGICRVHFQRVVWSCLECARQWSVGQLWHSDLVSLRRGCMLLSLLHSDLLRVAVRGWVLSKVTPLLVWLCVIWGWCRSHSVSPRWGTADAEM